MTKATAPTRPLTPAEADVLATHIMDEAQVQECLLELLRRQESCLRRNDLAGVSQCLAEASPLLERMEDVTRRRARLFQNLSRTLGLSERGLRFSGLATLASPEQRCAIEAAIERLSRALQGVSRQNQKNRALVRNGLDINHALVRTLLGAGAEPPRTYDRTARAHQGTTGRCCLNTEL